MNTLKNKQGRNPFKVPDNYFEEVNRKIIASTAGFEPQVKKGTIMKKIRPYLLAAASVTGFIILSYVAARYFTADKTSSASDNFYAESISEPLVNDIDIFTLEDNAAALELPDQLTGISSSEIIDYLLLENIEINDIYEVL